MLPEIMIRVNLILVFIFITSLGFGQDRMYVTAKSGLIVRDKPSLISNKIFHLPLNTMVMISEKTGVKLIIKDEGRKINGEWIKIRGFEKDKYGYVFDGFLTIKKPNIWYSGKEAYYKTYAYENQQEGTFESESISKEYLAKNLPYIKPNLKTLKPKEFPYFFNPQNKEVILFENHNLNSLKPIAKLNNLVQVKIDSTFYKFKYKDYTNCVWNRIKINKNYYYVDIDIHDFSFSKDLEKLKQKVVVVGQYDGYDGAYHLAYPEHFFMIFIDYDNKVINRTKVLDFHLNDEFAFDEEILNIGWVSEKPKLL